MIPVRDEIIPRYHPDSVKNTALHYVPTYIIPITEETGAAYLQ